MDNPLWERILIDWVNCLKLSTPIQKLDDLRDGSFFTNLYKVIKKSSKVDCDVLTSIFDTLSEHYAEFVIPNKSEIHLHDLPKDYLCAITSLLMHYTCIHDRRDVLTSPLCFNLQEITQIKIKTFLELIQECTQLNYTELSSIIKNCMENIEHLNLDLSSINISCVSPLHSVLQTPIKSCRIFQRDKEITKLKAQVELFQEEKENLEKDLKGQIEKSKKLEKQLSQKKLEISNLRSEVMDLEDRTPPYYRDKDFREMQKILRIKVDSLEKNLEQSDKENLQLREERDQERAQVKQLESRCKTWLEKFIDAENNLQSLTENYKEQLKKNENLRAHCSELENLLEELRPKSNNDSCTEESFHNSIRRSRDFETQEEDLAQSVVDVQLKEIQKENETLKVIFEEVKNDCKRLKDEINTHVLEKSILHEEKRQMETELQEANGKIEEFMLNYEQLLNDWKMVNQEKNFVVKQKSELSDRNEILKSSIKKLQQESVKLTEELEINKKEKRNCIEIQKTLEKQIECILESKENLEMDLEKITIEKCQLSDKTDELKIKNNQLLEEIQTLTKENDIILEKLKATSDSLSISETSLKNISKEKHLIEEELELVSSKIIELTKLNVNAEKYEDATNQFDTPKNKENLQIIKMVELQIENLTKDNGILKETVKAALTDKEYLNETCESLKLALDERISENDRIIKQSQELFEEKTKLTSENNELYKDIERLENSVEKLKGELATFVEEREKLEEQLTSEYNKLDELLRDELSKNDKLENDLRLSNSEKNEFSKNILTLQSVNEELNEIITCKEQLVLKLENEIRSLKQQLELMEIENSTILDNLKITTDKMLNLERSLEIVTNENSQYLDKLTSANTENESLKLNIIHLNGEIESILNKCEELTDNVHKLNEEKTFELENKSQTILDLNDLKMQLKVTNDDNEKLIVEKSNLSETLKVITVEKQQLADDLIFLTDKYNALEFEYKALKSEKQVLVESVYAMQFEKDQISDKLSQVTKSLKCAVDDFSQENKLLTQKLNQEEVLQKAIKEKDTALDHLQVKISDNEIAILELKEINNKLEISNNELTDKLAVMLNENTILKDRINKMEETTKLITTLSEEKDSLLRDVNITKEETVKELEASKMEIEKLQSELENLALEKTDTLYKLSEEKRVISDFLDLNNNELQKVLQEKEVILGALEFSNNEMVVLQEEKETLLKEIEKLTKVKNEFSEQLDKTSQENVDLSEQLQNILKKNHENAEQVKDLKEKVTQLTEENTQLLGKLTTVSNDLEETAVTNESLKTTCSQLKKELEEKSELLEKISEEHKDIFDIVDRLSKEKIDMGHTIDTLSEENMLLKQNLSYSKNQVADLMEEKTKLIDCLDLTDKELQKVKKDRNDILEGQTKIMKETQSNLLLAHQSAVDVKNDLLKRIETAETEKEILRKQMELDTKNIQESYASVLQANSKLELEIISLRKKLEDKNQKRNEYVQIKEAYEKLLEENSKLLTDIDTIKYKRSRDRDEFVSLLKKEREDGIARENKKIKDVRFEYENKLEKMKEKMLKLYRDEVGKEMMKVKAEQSESMCLVKTIEDLKNELFETQQKLHMLETERDMLRINAMHSSRESLRSVPESRNSIRGSVTSLRSIGNNAKSMAGSRQTIKKGSSTSVLQNNYKDVDRRTATLPRAITQIQETVTISRRTSLTNVPNIEMEDEDDDFNNKYLADLKAGQCIVGDNGRESIVRFSELAWRNSMLPPHLKSSYPAETQFVSPSKFREDELKGGNIELDDSLSKLLPGEKPRQKKDFGTTTYKKPGPPTPSKNGGRLSLQGNEIQPLREQNERTPKKLTPSRIKALFMGKSSIRDNSENQPVTPRTKQRLSIFRKQR